MVAYDMLDAPDLGNEDGVMPKEQSPGKPTTRRYSPEEKASAVRMVRALREELGTDHGTVQRVARQLGYGIESVRSWVRRADIDDGHARGVSTTESQRVKDLEQEIRELKRVDEILKRAASFFGAELDRCCARGRAVTPWLVRRCRRSGTTTTGSTVPASCGRQHGVLATT
jgi:transposase